MHDIRLTQAGEAHCEFQDLEPGYEADPNPYKNLSIAHRMLVLRVDLVHIKKHQKVRNETHKWGMAHHGCMQLNRVN